MLNNTENIFNYSRGPQFKNKGAAILFFVAIISALISIVNLISGEYMIALPLMIIGCFTFSYVLNIQGFEINYNEFKIRDYTKYLWFKFGKWDNIENYKHVYLTKGKLEITASIRSECSNDISYYYFVKLVDELKNKEIILAEFKEYYEAQKLLAQVSENLKIEGKIYVKKAETLSEI